MPSKRTSTRKRSGIALLREKLNQIQLATTLTGAICLANDCLVLVDEIETGEPRKPKPAPEPSPRCACGCRKVASVLIVGQWWASSDCYMKKAGML